MVCHKVAIKVLAQSLQCHLRVQPEKDLPPHPLNGCWQHIHSSTWDRAPQFLAGFWPEVVFSSFPCTSLQKDSLPHQSLQAEKVIASKLPRQTAQLLKPHVEVVYYHFCHILLVKSKSPCLSHIPGVKTPQGVNTRRWG